MWNARSILNSISSNEILSRGNHIQLYYHFTWQMVTVREHICSHSDSIYALNFLYVWFSISKILSKYDNIYNAVMTHLFEKWAQYCKITRHILAPLTVNVNIFVAVMCKGQVSSYKIYFSYPHLAASNDNLCCKAVWSKHPVWSCKHNITFSKVFKYSSLNKLVSSFKDSSPVSNKNVHFVFLIYWY